MKKLVALALAVVSVIVVMAIPAFAATTTIGVRDDFFSPSSKVISKGTTVKFVWKGSAPHNVVATAGSPATFRSGTPKTSGTFTYKFKRAGLYRILCNVHPGMRLNLRVR